ncbi:DinB family protein [Chryseobacterium echinoideorum]|uniref:DinB family protein n=1 Tax=Chryseobacterium echinoideorum TaxID=1549648 RepID=UPI001623D121|nr:DinB family protein [Chryseobacterium echinoideorum]
MNKKIKFSQSIKIYASKETVWKTVLSDEFYQISWGAALSTTWQTGSIIQFTGTWEDVEYVDKGIIREHIENSFLKFTYWSSFWKAEDVPEEYCDISYTVKQLDEHSCEFTIKQVGFRDQVHYDDTVEFWKNSSQTLKYLSEKDGLTLVSNAVFNELVSIIATIPAEKYNAETSGNWNPAQIVEHIIMGNTGMKQFLTEVPYTSDIPFDYNVQAIRDFMSNNDVKYQAPDFLIPATKQYDMNEHRELLLNLQAEINDCIATLDFEDKCGITDMPPFGFMSIYEWLNFSVFHILRHKDQLKSYR